MKKGAMCFKCGKEGEDFSPYLKTKWNDDAVLTYCFYYDWESKKQDIICLSCFNNLTNEELLSCSMTNWVDCTPFQKTYRKWKKLVIKKIKKEGIRNYHQVCHGGTHCCSRSCCSLFPKYVKSSQDCEDYWDEVQTQIMGLLGGDNGDT